MHNVNRSALVPYSSAQMFDVVNDVVAYPQFLPWCVASEIVSQDESLMVARLTLAKVGLKHSFTTSNVLSFPRTIKMQLVEGPFSKLSGGWTFTQLGEDGSRIEMDLNFDFNSRIFSLTLASVFNQAADKMVDAFCKRAEVLYG